MPKVSVLICVYNDEKNIGRAINSILTQTFTDFEIVIVNDGSTDCTLSVLEQYAQKDKRIKIINQVNQGTTIAANNGLKHCDGQFVARLDSDDFSYPYRLTEEVQILESDEAIGLVGGGSHIVDNNGKVLGARNINASNPEEVLQHRCIFQQSDVMFRKDLVMHLSGYRAKFRNAQDYDLWLRISEKAKIIKLNRILGAWTLNAGGYTLSRKAEQKAEDAIIKNMAKLRRNGKYDGYDQYTPPEKPNHRRNISKDDYKYIVASILLKDLQLKEARNNLNSVEKSLKSRLFITATYFPSFLIKGLFSFREFYLNKVV